MPADSELCIVLVFPELLGTYGDRGNALALMRRAEARGLGIRLVEVPYPAPLPTGGDVYLVGGSEDAAQVLALRALLEGGSGREVLARAPACLAVCAGFQLLAREFRGADGHREPGLGLLDVSCGRLPGRRAVGEVVTRPVGIAGLPALTGYENHQGNAVLGPSARPLGSVVTGVGNGCDGLEGAVQGNLVATYLHGPVLVRNPGLADHLLERSTGPLPAYDDEAVDQLRRERLAAAARSRSRSTSRSTSRSWRPSRHRHVLPG
jgi:lipid II isoglutaminyl synthase (glutamine-hydrolysing)